ncbi:hypothetical protein PG993_000218 [Apiospora rasikravindrae]|uniref:Uncharacterized protein n=1 Tax=Apiospora rasikravindrae TaxID=990691 RepID=A0ABR1U7W8_9PEZI
MYTGYLFKTGETPAKPPAMVRLRVLRRQRQRVIIQVLHQQPLLPVVPDDDVVEQPVLVLGPQLLAVVAVGADEDGLEGLVLRSLVGAPVARVFFRPLPLARRNVVGAGELAVRPDPLLRVSKDLG